jgi:hypothetical protein
MTRAPDHFDGSLEQLTESFILPNLPSAEAVTAFHKVLVDYCGRPDPLFLIRYMRDTNRGDVYSTAAGDRFKATDNAPVWWVHHALFHEIELSAGTFPEVIATIPTHFFEVARQIPKNISSAGWHVAHIADVKDRNVEFSAWTRADLITRFLRNIHPCNNFPIPKLEWQKWGADKRVISFFAAMYSERYSGVWHEFQKLARINTSTFPFAGAINYCYAAKLKEKASDETEREVEERGTLTAFDRREVEVRVVTYSASRLLFKADIIDELAGSDRFRVVTPVGSYEMSKKDFLRVFSRVVETRSYRESRVYHYPKVPAAAAQFKVAADDQELNA